jgi:predicted amidohydrolase YtcJ
MKKFLLIFIFTSILIFSHCSGGKGGDLGNGENIEADLILTNATIITADDKQPACEAIAIKDGKILSIGSFNDMEKFKGQNTNLMDLTGKTIIPGLHDAHVHFESGAKAVTERLSVRFLGLEEILEKVKESVQISPERAVIYAYHFNHAYFKDKKWPSRYDLDKVAPQNPVIITRVDGHSVWLNSLALKMAGITNDTPDPQGGEIQRFADGTPTGILKETAEDLVKNITGPKMKVPGAMEGNTLEAGIAYANKLGLTSVTTSGSLQLIQRLNQLKSEGKLTLRFNVWLPIKGIQEYLDKGIAMNQGDDMVKVSFLKIFCDGTIGSATAAMFEPFKHRPESKGLLIHPVEELDAMIEKAHQNNWQIGVHSIGNRGVHLVLNAVEKAQKKLGKKGLRHRIEHSQFVRDDDLLRYKDLEMIPSMQPTHCTTDLLVVEDRIGTERARQGYRWNSFKEKGIMMSFGSDWPVEPLDPRRGLYSAVERKNIQSGTPENGWFPEEQISIKDAVKYFTLGSAYASFNEKVNGSIEEGKLADLTVFDGNMLEMAAKNKKELLEMAVHMTIVNGAVVYSKK